MHQGPQLPDAEGWAWRVCARNRRALLRVRVSLKTRPSAEILLRLPVGYRFDHTLGSGAYQSLKLLPVTIKFIRIVTSAAALEKADVGHFWRLVQNLRSLYC